MSYSQEISQRQYQAESYRYRAAPVSNVEAAYFEQASQRLDGAFKLLERGSDHLEKLHAILDAKTFTTPSMAYDAQRLRAVGGLIAETLPLGYALR